MPCPSFPGAPPIVIAGTLRTSATRLTSKLVTPEPSQRSATGWGVAIGVLALAVGVAAAVFAQSAKLDATKALAGGTYIKETYRLPLLIAGISVGLLGVILVPVSAG